MEARDDNIYMYVYLSLSLNEDESYSCGSGSDRMGHAYIEPTLTLRISLSIPFRLSNLSAARAPSESERKCRHWRIVKCQWLYLGRSIPKQPPETDFTGSTVGFPRSFLFLSLLAFLL
jgi:hypothetical protein